MVNNAFYHLTKYYESTEKIKSWVNHHHWNSYHLLKVNANAYALSELLLSSSGSSFGNYIPKCSALNGLSENE